MTRFARSFALITAAFIAASPSCDVPPPQGSVRQPYCEVHADGRVAGPSADVCDQLARRWQLLMGSRAIKGVIWLVHGTGAKSSSSAQEWMLEWSAPPARRSGSVKTRADGFVANEAEDVLTHEAGHGLFSSYTIFFARPNGYDGYGSIVPDWFDESPAVWMESAELRTRRMQSIIGAKPSLVRLVTMSHPGREQLIANARNPERRWRERTVVPPCAQCTFLAESLRTKYRVTDVGVDARGYPDTNVWYSDSNPQNNETLEEREFYPLSYALLRFIHQRGGSAAVRELISRYREDPRPRASVLVGLPGLSGSIAAIERGWWSFLANPPAEER